jgi:hypothetical protein
VAHFTNGSFTDLDADRLYTAAADAHPHAIADSRTNGGTNGGTFNHAFADGDIRIRSAHRHTAPRAEFIE